MQPIPDNHSDECLINMNFTELQVRLHELNQEYKTKGPNVDSMRETLRDALSEYKLTVMLAKDYGSRNGLDEYVIADNEELDIPEDEE